MKTRKIIAWPIFNGLVLISMLAIFLMISNLSYQIERFDSEKCHFADVGKAPKIQSSLWKQHRFDALKILTTNFTSSNTAIVMFSRNESVGNDGYEFRQEPNYYYISGVDFPGSAVVIDGQQSTLFLTTVDSAFDKPYPSREIIMDEYGFDNVMPFQELWANVNERKYSRLFTNTDNELKSAIMNLRKQKSKEEVDLIRYATMIAASAHRELMKRVDKQSSEYSLIAIFKQLSFQCGCRFQAYSPIVGFDDHASVLHYQDISIDQGLVAATRENSIVLVDASGSFRNYASDITRTLPLNGEFSPFMRMVYKAVLKVNKLTIAKVAPGITFGSLQKFASDVLLRELVALRLLTNGTMEDFKQNDLIRVFMPHGLGHTVGLDVHDIQKDLLDVNDVITIEPGIYFNHAVFQKARNDPAQHRYIN